MESPWFVLPMIFLVLGPFALPLLWRSRCFSRMWKVIFTVGVVAVTVWAAGLVVQIVNQNLESFRQLRDALK
jgi:uncharacterized membrane protein